MLLLLRRFSFSRFSLGSTLLVAMLLSSPGLTYANTSFKGLKVFVFITMIGLPFALFLLFLGAITVVLLVRKQFSPTTRKFGTFTLLSSMVTAVASASIIGVVGTDKSVALGVIFCTINIALSVPVAVLGGVLFKKHIDDGETVAS